MNDSLFDEIDRVFTGPAGDAEPSFRYINRSARLEFARVRRELDDWYLRYPKCERLDVRGAFRSSIDKQHYGAFFELLLHEILLRLGYSAVPHPDVPGTSRHPDFLASKLDMQQFYLEGRVVTRDDLEPQGFNNIDSLVDYLNDGSPNDFSIWLTPKNIPLRPLPQKELKREILEWLASLSVDEVMKEYENSGFDRLPSKDLSAGGITLSVRAFPKKLSARAREGQRIVGGVLRSGAIDGAKGIRDAIVRKAKRYGKMGAPYIIAVDNLGTHSDDIDEAAALLGDESFLIPREGDDRRPVLSRVPNGALYGPRGPQLTRVSGVLIIQNASPTRLSRAKVTLYQNHWAEYPLDKELSELPHMVAEKEGWRKVDGVSLSELFGLPHNWPEE